jgi:hypothetical protein
MKTEPMHWTLELGEDGPQRVHEARQTALTIPYAVPYPIDYRDIALMAAMLDDAEARLVALGQDPPSAAMWRMYAEDPTAPSVPMGEE